MRPASLALFLRYKAHSNNGKRKEPLFADAAPVAHEAKSMKRLEYFVAAATVAALLASAGASWGSSHPAFADRSTTVVMR